MTVSVCKQRDVCERWRATALVRTDLSRHLLVNYLFESVVGREGALHVKIEFESVLLHKCLVEDESGLAVDAEDGRLELVPARAEVLVEARLAELFLPLAHGTRALGGGGGGAGGRHGCGGGGSAGGHRWLGWSAGERYHLNSTQNAIQCT